MLLRKSTFFLGILTLLFTITFCFPWAAIAQFSGRRLIPVSSNQREAYRPQNFVVYGRACAGYPPVDNLSAECDEYTGDGAYNAGIAKGVTYRQIPHSDLESEKAPERMPNLEEFFKFGGTLELLTTDFTLARYDLVISEIMWAIDRGVDDTTGTIANPEYDDTKPINMSNPVNITIPQSQDQEVQWIELYNTTDTEITAELYFLFTPLESHPLREGDTVDIEGPPYRVLDAVDTLFPQLWELPGVNGRRPNIAFASAYRKIDYDVVEDPSLVRRRQLSGVPFGSNPDSWEETPENGRRNTELRINIEGEAVEIPAIGTPGAKHVLGIFPDSLQPLPVYSDMVVINEVRNDTSTQNIDWVELKNISGGAVQIEDWELSIVTGVGKDNLLVDLPEYELSPDEILLLLNKDPWLTPIIGGISIIGENAHLIAERAEPARSYFVGRRLDLPNTGRFVLLLRSESDQNGKDKAIEDYAGNGFFIDTTSSIGTGFWPRVVQQVPTNVADFGENTFASRHTTWARTRYEEDDGHHENAWEEVGTQGGLGYDPGANILTTPGTPGYENNALKTTLADAYFRPSITDLELTDGEISISEIMYDLGPNRNRAQWIELYNSSRTQAINLKGWELEIRNLADEERTYVSGRFEFEDAIILPNQTLLLVSKRYPTNVPSNRVYNLYQKHRRELGLTRGSGLLLSPTAFYLKLTDKANPNLNSDDIVVDEVGNFEKMGESTRGKSWDLPKVDPERRRSIVRLYGYIFNPNESELYGEPNPPEDGLSPEGWRRFPVDGLSLSFYGLRDDLANPGYRLGGPLPVALSSFRPVRIETGEVLIRWTTESELNNAGFNIRRSENRQDGFTLINLRGIIPGNGTSSERHAYQWTDTTAAPNVVYYYRIEDVSFKGARQTLATVRLKGDVSATNKLTTTWSSLKTPD